ncbi:MAG: aldehyde dehydrogenase family protein [Planctomycetota bacterium]|nr:aldehyde dehydrogenase family protein [Planctomycetota bacterium]
MSPFSQESTREIARQIEAACAAMNAPQWQDDAHRATLLDAIAHALRSREHEIISVASDESALTPDELAPEFARMWRTLAMFAQTLRDSTSQASWRGVAIVPAEQDAAQSIGPNHDLRRMRFALPGVVAVFGASNFPLAYGMLGGDTASALAAGCAVAVKQHPAQPRTGTLLATLAHEALDSRGMDQRILTLIADDGTDSPRVAEALVAHRSIVGVGFTGSRIVGDRIAGLGAQRTPPIPVFAEMGSLNPIVVLPHAWHARADAITDSVIASLLQRHGQQCTAPGLLLLPTRNAAQDAFARFRAALDAAPARRMLSDGVATNYVRRVEEVAALSCVLDASAWRRLDSRTTRPRVFLADGNILPHHAAAWDEIFGPAMIISWYATPRDALTPLNGTLTATLHAEPNDDVADILASMLARAGRVIVNGVPTGVRVCPATVHGGPWPSTNRPDFTAVGPDAMLRWTRPVTLQNWPAAWRPSQVRGT